MSKCVSRLGSAVTVWSDIGCPWATLALHTLRDTAYRNGVGLTIEHRVFPLELFNGRPTPKPIIDAEIVAVAGLRPEVDWRLWNGADWTYPVTTLPAMAAVQAAADPTIGGLAAADQLDSTLRGAFYRDSRCISVHAEILAAAGLCPDLDVDALEAALRRGSGIAAVFSDWKAAAEAKVMGSPHIFLGPEDHEGLHNPGVTYHWTSPPAEGGLPRFVSYDTAWANETLTQLGHTSAKVEGN